MAGIYGMYHKLKDNMETGQQQSQQAQPQPYPRWLYGTDAKTKSTFAYPPSAIRKIAKNNKDGKVSYVVTIDIPATLSKPYEKSGQYLNNVVIYYSKEDGDLLCKALGVNAEKITVAQDTGGYSGGGYQQKSGNTYIPPDDVNDNPPF